jgi:hypothetical protein
MHRAIYLGEQMLADHETLIHEKGLRPLDPKGHVLAFINKHTNILRAAKMPARIESGDATVGQMNDFIDKTVMQVVRWLPSLLERQFAEVIAPHFRHKDGDRQFWESLV